VYSVGLHELPAYLKEYLRRYPEVNVHVEYARPNRIYENVIGGQIDLGIVAYPQKHPQIVIIPFREDHLVLACPAGHPLATLKKVPVAKLEGQTFIAYEQDLGTRKATDQVLRNHHVSVKYVGEYDNIETIKRAVEIGQGVAIVPYQRSSTKWSTAQSRSCGSPTRWCSAHSESSISGVVTYRPPR